MRRTLIALALLNIAAFPGAAVAAPPTPPQAREVPPESGAATSSTLQGLACPGPTTCVGVGTSLYAGGKTTAVGAGTSAFGVWQQTVLPLNSGSAYDSVSCIAVAECEAVGTDTVHASTLNSGKAFESGLVVSILNGFWNTSLIGLPNNANLGAGGATQVTLDSVSCPGTYACVAVGSYTASDGTVQAMTATQVGQNWAQSATELTLPATAAVTAQNADLHSVVCSSPGDCQAVGWYTNASGTTKPMVATETNGTWAPAVAITLTGSAVGAAELRSLFCTSAGNCAAVGHYTTAHSGQRPLALTESNGTWRAAFEPPLPADARAGATQSADLDSVVCSSVGNCQAVGGYANSLGDRLPLAETESSGSWTLTAGGVQLPPNASTKPGAQRANLSAVVCPVSTSCLAVGDYIVQAKMTEAMSVAIAPLQTGSVSINAVKVAGDQLSATVACGPHRRQACLGTLTLGAFEHLNGKRITAVTVGQKKKNTLAVTFGKSSYRLRGGAHSRLTIKLDGAGERLLTQFHTLQLTLAATAVGQTAPAVASTVAFTAPQPPTHK